MCNAITLTDNQSPEVFRYPATNLPFWPKNSKSFQVEVQILVLIDPCYPVKMAAPSWRLAGPRRRSSTMALASSSTSRALARARASSSSSPSSSVPPTRDDDLCALKTKLFLLSAQTDRGQLLFRQKVYNMEDYFRAKEQQARVLVENIVSSGECKLATSPDIQDGTWELAYSTAQLFRCSPFFLAIAESMEGYTWRAPWSDESTAVCSSELFFRLHELQVMSWGASTGKPSCSSSSLSRR